MTRPGAQNHIPRRICPTCGARFFTGVGLDEHTRLGCVGGGGPVVIVRRGYSPETRATWAENGRAVAALNNSRREACPTCGKSSTPSGLALHRRASGH